MGAAAVTAPLCIPSLHKYGVQLSSKSVFVLASSVALKQTIQRFKLGNVVIMSSRSDRDLGLDAGAGRCRVTAVSGVRRQKALDR